MTRSITDEIKQTRPFRTKSQEASVALMRTAHLLRRQAEAVVAVEEITSQQYNVLRILRGAGEKGLPTLEIAERMIEQTPGITRLIDRLETKKLVLRERCKTDRRQVFCKITRGGLALLAKLDAPVTKADSILSKLTKRDLAQLVDILDRARNGSHP